MNTRELEERLMQQGCNPSLYAIGSRGAASDAYCLTHTGAQWQVVYTERGQDSPPIHVSASESEACDFFFRHIMAMRHEHCVGFFRSQPHAEALKARLQASAVDSRIDRIPFGGPSDPRFRVFVTGPAIFAAKALMGSVPLMEPGA